MKTCQEFDTAITDYLMEEADKETRLAVEEHLVACQECRARFDERKGAAEALVAIGKERPVLSPERRDMLLAAAGNPVGTARTRRRFPWMQSAAALFLVGAVIFVVVGNPPGAVNRNADRSVAMRKTVLDDQRAYREVKRVAGDTSAGARTGAEPRPTQSAAPDPAVVETTTVLKPQEIPPQMQQAFEGNEAPDDSYYRIAITKPDGTLSEAPALTLSETPMDNLSVSVGVGGGGQQTDDSNLWGLVEADEDVDAPESVVFFGNEPSSKKAEKKAPVGTARPGAAQPDPRPSNEPFVADYHFDDSKEDPRKPDEEFVERLEDMAKSARIQEKDVTPTPDDRVQLYLRALKRRPGEQPHDMFYRYWGDNPFVDTNKDAQATFGMDVDTASYTLARNYLNKGMIPPKAAIRTEEFVNYIPSNYAAPDQGDFGIHVELAPSRFARQNDVFLMKVGVKAREVAEEARKPLALTFVIDVSGSMSQDNRLELVKDAIRILASELNANDTIGIVVFESTARNVLEHVSAQDLDTIAAALTPLRPGSSTNVQQGLDLGYAMATRFLKKDAMNRVVLFSDGVANTGQTTVDAILARVADYRQQGVFLNTFGVGMGNHNDHLLEQLADKGDGQCAYIDSRREAVRLFRKNLVGSFQTIAKDAKIQVDFDREIVASHRQIGYENRAIAHKDFRNDAIDAGEVNAGHEVVALFEVQLRSATADAVIFGQMSPATVKVRYKQVDTGEVIELAHEARGKGITNFSNASPRFRASAMAAAFADILRDSYWSKNVKLAEIEELAQSLLVLDNPEDSRISEMVALMKQANSLIDARAALLSEHAKAMEEVKYNYYLRNRIAEARSKDARDLQARLEEENKRLEEELRRLIRE